MNRLSSGTLTLATIAAALAASLATAAAGPVTLTVTNVRNDNGVVRCGLFNSAAGFGEPGRQTSEAVGRINNGRAVCTFKQVPAGTYAAAVFHAEQNEQQLTTGLFGKPKQGVGFSRNPSMTFGRPGFDAAAFQVGSDPVNLTIKLVY